MPSPTMATAARILQFAHVALLAAGRTSAITCFAGETHAAGDGLGRHAVVAGEHAHIDAERTQRGDGLGARFFDLVGHGDGTDKLAVLGKEQRRFASVANCSATPAGTSAPSSFIRRTLPAAMAFCPSRAVTPRPGTAAKSSTVRATIPRASHYGH